MMQKQMWMKLALMLALSFGAMYVLMYLMVNSAADLYANTNQIYMTGAMVAAMLVIELAVMGAMYKGATARYALIAIGGVALVLCVLFTRYQTGIGDKGFLRSMIPHHSGAILMCSNPNLEDAEIRELCRQIIEGQQQEIDQMKAILRRKP